MWESSDSTLPTKKEAWRFLIAMDEQKDIFEIILNRKKKLQHFIDEMEENDDKD